MKRLLAIAALIALGGCQQMGVAEFTAPDGGKVNPAVYKVARARCEEQYNHRYANQQRLYGQYGDYVQLIDDAKACMLRQGVRVTGFRQKDGRLTQYPNQPKWIEY